MAWHTAIGFSAAIIATASFVPQVLKTIKLKKTKDISLLMYAMFVSGVSLWLLYGIFITDWPLIIANVVTATLAGTVLFMKLRYG